MDAKPMTPAEIAARLRNRSVGGYLPSLHAAAADCIDAQAAEITAIRAERDRAMKACEALAARLAVPAEEALDLLTRTLRSHKGLDALGIWAMRDQAANALTALRARVAGLEGARVVTDEMVGRAVKAFAGVYRGSLDEDMRAALTAALSPSAQEAPDAE